MWDRIQRMDPPDPDGSESSFHALDAMHRSPSEETVELPGELIDLDDERYVVKEQIKAAKKRSDQIDALIRARMGNAKHGRLANGVVYSISRVKRAAYECKATEYTQLRRSAPKGQ
jgi:glutamyl-tRNA reductase